jgi:beta-glucanase (GH16 family)
VTTQSKFDFLYGRMDIRAQLPYGQGIWPAFWLLPTVQPAPLASHEVDIVELLGQDPNLAYMVNHWYTSRRYCTFTGPDFSRGYHVFSFVWSATSLEWYIDGTRRCEVTEGIPDTKMYLLLDTYTGGWPGPPDQTTPFPEYTLIDYVRIYRHN